MTVTPTGISLSNVNFTQGLVGIQVSPLILPNNVLFHIDASDAASVTLTESDIDQIDDLSGNGRNFVDGTSKPVYVIAGQNGLNTMDFSTATVGNGNASLDLSGSSITIKHVFVVAQHDAATFATFDGLFNSSAGGDLVLLSGEPTGPGTEWFKAVGPLFSISNYYENLVNRPTGSTTTLTSWTVHSISDSTGHAAGGWTIGSDRLIADRNWEGSIGEVIAYDIQVNATDRNNIISRLKTKWGIA